MNYIYDNIKIRSYIAWNIYNKKIAFGEILIIKTEDISLDFLFSRLKNETSQLTYNTSTVNQKILISE